MPNLTVNVTPDLLRQAKIYASQHKTTISKIVRDHLKSLTGPNRSVIEKYADGSMSSFDAQNALGLATRDELFHAVREAGHSIYHVSRESADSMAETVLLLTELK